MEGHEVIEARESGPDPGDREILARASAEGCVLVTMDKDFGEFIFVEGQSHCGLVRLPDVPSDKRITLMEKVLASHAADLNERSVVTVRGGRIRTSRPGG